jgi:guanosine-3',5'-bis(diphosphate) 3'-pyrophosphohydrolase
LFNHIKSINSIDLAIKELESSIFLTPLISKAISFVIDAHDGQFRKSGEPYVIHPILVASITARFSNDEAMVVSSLLHDIIEDTDYSLEYIEKEYGKDIAHIVDGLTKIVEIREHELAPSKSNEKLLASALTFRKMLIASIDDVRVLVVKLCDRVHNMLTLEALPSHKQLRIAEESMVVYAPIAHRLGMATLKKHLEDLSFLYLYPKEYSEIDEYLKGHKDKLQVVLNSFLSKIESRLEKQGYIKDYI